MIPVLNRSTNMPLAIKNPDEHGQSKLGERELRSAMILMLGDAVPQSSKPLCSCKLSPSYPIAPSVHRHG